VRFPGLGQAGWTAIFNRLKFLVLRGVLQKGFFLLRVVAIKSADRSPQGRPSNEVRFAFRESFAQDPFFPVGEGSCGSEGELVI